LKVPELREALSAHTKSCAKRVTTLERQRAIVVQDIEIMEKVLALSTCASWAPPATSGTLLQCQHQGRGTSFITFGQRVLREQVTELQSRLAQESLQEALKQAYEQAGPSKEEKPVVLAQESLPRPRGRRRLQVPGRMRRHKCGMKSNPSCPLMRDKFLEIQAGVEDKEAALKAELRRLDASCARTQRTFHAQLQGLEARHKAEQAHLAAASQRQGEAEEASRLKELQRVGLDGDYRKTMQACNENVDDVEAEICSFLKIRAEVALMEGAGKAFIQDCEVSDWTQEECSVSCGRAGIQRLYRSIIVHPKRGAPCPPLELVRRCGEAPCPKHCELDDWGGWGSCSALCGGGVRERVRAIVAQPAHGGRSCGVTSEVESCNAQACDRDCTLGPWTEWSACSKACSGGLQRRTRPVDAAAVGQGRCPASDDHERLWYRKCNSQLCQRALGQPTLRCGAKLDVVLVLDGSGSIGALGWQAMKTAGRMLASAMMGGSDAVQLAVQLSSGPSSWSAYQRCTGSGAAATAADLTGECGIQWVSHFTTDTEAVAQQISMLNWPQTGSLTPAALSAAGAELQQSRRCAQSVVIVLTDGRPMSPRRTRQAAMRLRKSARLMWVPVVNFGPMNELETWASRPLRENLLIVRDFATLSKAETIDAIIADMCPSPQ